MTTAVAAVLRHTGLQVPDDRLTMAAPGLIAYDGELVGEVAIDVDDDFAEVFAAFGPGSPVTPDSFYDWAAGCRTTDGDPIDMEDVFTYLRAEYATERALRRAATTRTTVAQAMVPFGDGYMPGETLHVENWETRELVMARAATAGCPEGTWWRIFNGTGWDELDPSQTIG